MINYDNLICDTHPLQLLLFILTTSAIVTIYYLFNLTVYSSLLRIMASMDYKSQHILKDLQTRMTRSLEQ